MFVACLKRLLILGCVSVAALPVSAQSFLDELRSSDLNDYALGVVVSTSPAIYRGDDDSTYLYPYLTSVQEQHLTDDWFVVGEGDVGFRKIMGNWTLGAVGRVQTLGFDESPELPGVNQRKWAIELAPLVQYRALPVKVTFKPYFEISNRHSGRVDQLEFAYPFQGSRGYLTPAVEFTHQTDDYNDYYFGVTAGESLAGVPVYQPDASLNASLKVSWGYYLADNWILTGRVEWTQLDDEIADSPLIEDDATWHVSLGVAYNADFFRESSLEEYGLRNGLSLRVMAISNDVETEFVRDATDGSSGARVDMEDLLGLDDSVTVQQLDIVYRFLDFHRLEFSFWDMDREGRQTPQRDFEYGDSVFLAGSPVDVSLKTESWRLGYGFSLLRDGQKELGVSVGLHQTDVLTELSQEITGAYERSNPDPILPVLGAFGSVALGNSAEATLDVQYYDMDIDRFDGSIVTARFEVLRHFSRMTVGIGYNLYSVNLESSDDEHPGRLKFSHQGPLISLSYNF